MKTQMTEQFDLSYLIYVIIASSLILFCAWSIFESSLLFSKKNLFKASNQQTISANHDLYETSQEIINITVRKQANWEKFKKANQHIQEI